MNRIIHTDIQQRTPEWHRLKWGRISSTGASGIATKGKDSEGLGSAILNTCHKIVAQHKTKFYMPEGYISEDMQRGIMIEPDAIEAYENEVFLETKEIGFVSYGKYFGDSPDSHVSDDGCLEIKCLNATNHEKCLYTKSFDKKHLDQMWWHIFIGGKKWCDFVSFNPEFPEGQRIFIKRVTIPDDKLELIESKVKAITEHLDKRLNK